MEKSEMINKLIEAGIPAGTAARMVESLEDKPKKATAAKRAYAISNNPNRKIDIEVEVTIVCDCCRAEKTVVKTIKGTKDSPTKMKTTIMLCEKCPDYFRALTHEQLVSLALIRRHTGFMVHYPQDSSQVKFAKKYSPEEVIGMKVNC